MNDIKTIEQAVKQATVLSDFLTVEQLQEVKQQFEVVGSKRHLKAIDIAIKQLTQ